MNAPCRAARGVRWSIVVAALVVGGAAGAVPPRGGVRAHEPPAAVDPEAELLAAEAEALALAEAPCPEMRRSRPPTSGCDGCHAEQGVFLEHGPLERATREAAAQRDADRSQRVELETSVSESRPPATSIRHQPPAEAVRGAPLPLEVRLVPWDASTTAWAMVLVPDEDATELVRLERHGRVFSGSIPEALTRAESVRYWVHVTHRSEVVTLGDDTSPLVVPTREPERGAWPALAAGVGVVLAVVLWRSRGRGAGGGAREAGPPGAGAAPRRRRRATAAAAALALGPSIAVVAAPQTYFGTCIYDRYSSGAGTLANSNRVRLLDGQGNSAAAKYNADTGSAYPTTAARSSNRGIALDVWPDPDPAKAALGITFVRYLYVTDELNHRVRRFELGPVAGGKYGMVGNSSPAAYLRQWGTYGDALSATAPQFAFPRDVAVHPITHDVFVLDTMNARVQVFRLDAAQQLVGKPMTVRAARPSGDGYAMAQVNASGTHGFGRRGDHRDPEPPPIEVLGIADPLDDGGDGVGVAELGQAEFYNPQGIALDVDPGPSAASPSDDVVTLYVADTFNHRVQVFEDTTPGASAYDFDLVKVLGGWGTPTATDAAPGRFRYPRGLAVFRSGADVRLVVLDAINARVQVFDRSASGAFTIRTQWGGPATFVDLQDVDVDGAGRVYLTDPLNDDLTNQIRTRILQYDLEGNLLATLGAVPLNNSAFHAYGIDVVTVEE